MPLRDETIPTAALLAAAGGALGAVALILPWYQLDPGALNELTTAVGQGSGLVTPDQIAPSGLPEAMSISLESATREFAPRSIGYRALGPTSTMLQVWVIVSVLSVAWMGARRSVQQRQIASALLVCGIAFTLRVVWGLMHHPAVAIDRPDLAGLSGALVQPASGLWVAAISAACVLGAGLAARASSEPEASHGLPGGDAFSGTGSTPVVPLCTPQVAQRNRPAPPPRP